MARDSSHGPATALNGAGASAQPQAGPAGQTDAGPAGGAAGQPARRVALADKNVAMLSLPTRDLPSYYDSPSSPSAAGDSDWEDAEDPTASYVPTTNRGHKLSRHAPHTRRGRLGNHANVDGGFADPLSSGSLAPPAHKRRKLNDLASASSEAGFPVAPNLHLVPRPVHVLSRESDAPFPSYLPPVPQSPLDLLLQPAIQHTLGKKNATFHLLAESATNLIEQEAELVGALTKVCRGLRGEGFEWRWEGDDERRKAREDERRREREERDQKARSEREEREQKAEEDEAAASAAAADAAAAEVQAEEQTPAPAAMAVDSAAAASKETSAAAPEAAAAAAPAALDDDVKLEQATPVIPSAVAPSPSVVNPVPVPGVTPLSAESTPTGESRPDQATPAGEADAEMKDAAAAPAEQKNAAAATEGTPVAATEAPTPAPADGAPAPAAADVPAIVVGGSADDAATPADPAAVASTSEQPDATPAAPDAATAQAATATVAAAADGDASTTAEATPAPSGTDEPSVRRRSGRVATRGTGAGGIGGSMRHTRSRQSSPEEGYSSGADEFGAAGEGDSSLDEPSGAGGGGARAQQQQQQLVAEEEMPEYAARMVDPEVFVRSLFVSGDKVEMERVVPAPGGGVVGTGQMETLTPNEQEVLLHDCLTDLHRFLADTLEYRSRLLEIRDGTLGVERRRKGMHKAVRTVAMDWLEEEGAGMGVEPAGPYEQ
ncbi:uncharacterized protein JCM10292_006218 [Rhodotorula paludigena]|uniref:uncharacterized protein n=1 Tax=Rhodotorula paludigena TaxID=86838 RepID=UPI00316F4DAE